MTTNSAIARIKAAPRMENVPREKVVEYAAALIALVGHRKDKKMWRMSKLNIRILCQRPIRKETFDALSDALAEYNIMMIDNSDVEFSFIHADRINNWYRCGLAALTEEERRRPDLDAIEDEIGYTEQMEKEYQEHMASVREE